MQTLCILLVLITYGNGGTAPLISVLGIRCCRQSTACPSHFNPGEEGTQWVANGCTPEPAWVLCTWHIFHRYWESNRDSSDLQLKHQWLY